MAKSLGKVKHYGWIVAKDLGAVGAAVLSFVGVLALFGWATPDIISDFTPLAVGSLTAVFALITLKVSVIEGRDRARKERDYSVRPMMMLGVVDPREQPMAHRLECFAPTGDKLSVGVHSLHFSLENVGLGPAFEIDLFLTTMEGATYRAAYPIPRIKPDEMTTATVVISLPCQNIDHVVIRCDDMFGNRVFSGHGVDMSDPDRVSIYFNDHVRFNSVEESERYDKHFTMIYHSREQALSAKVLFDKSEQASSADATN